MQLDDLFEILPDGHVVIFCRPLDRVVQICQLSLTGDRLAVIEVQRDAGDAALKEDRVILVHCDATGNFLRLVILRMPWRDFARERPGCVKLKRKLGIDQHQLFVPRIINWDTVT